jgi:hypothetical protein
MAAIGRFPRFNVRFAANENEGARQKYRKPFYEAIIQLVWNVLLLASTMLATTEVGREFCSLHPISIASMQNGF